MVYSDLIFFLGLLPISILLSFFDRSVEYKNLILVLTSLVFFSWGRPFGVCLIFLTAILEWTLGLWIDKSHKNGRKGFLPLLIDAVMNIAVLILVTKKYMYINSDVFGFADIILPLSISFYVLKGFSYIYDVYSGKVKAERNVFYLLTYMCAYFFLPVGAQFRYDKIQPQLKQRSFNLNGMSSGLTAFVCGLSKAVILAAPLKKIADSGLSNENTTMLGFWIGSAAMTGVVYFLFTGFCDISYGIGRIYGFEFERNYKDLTAKGVYGGLFKNTNTVLSDLFTDISSNISKESRTAKAMLALILCAVGGIWYNRSLTFLLAGVILGVFLIMEHTILKSFFKEAPAFLRFIITYLGTVIISGIMFSGSLSGLKNHVLGLIGIGTSGIMGTDVRTALLNNLFIAIIAILTAYTPLKNKIKTKADDYSMLSIEKYGKINIIKTILTAILFIICIIIVSAANIKL